VKTRLTVKTVEPLNRRITRSVSMLLFSQFNALTLQRFNALTLHRFNALTL